MFRYIVIGLVLMKYCFKVGITQLEMWLPRIWQKITKLSLYASQPRSCSIMSVCRLRISEKIQYKIEAVNISFNLIQIVEITSIQNYVYRKINASLLFTRAHTHTHAHKYTAFVIYSTVGLCVISLWHKWTLSEDLPYSFVYVSNLAIETFYRT
jgi:hypothetical protein